MEMNSRITFWFSIGKSGLKIRHWCDTIPIQVIFLAGSLPSLLHTRSSEGAEGETGEALMLCKHCLAICETLVSCQHCFGHRSNSQHYASHALCYWQTVVGSPLSRSFERWLKLCAMSSCSDLQSGWLNLKVQAPGHSWKLWGKYYL